VRRLPIIARTSHVLAAVAALAGLAAWAFYLQQDLVLTHYDAKAHLVVARRIIDNLTPGWRQIGAVWLPLPHLLQALPTQVDLLYRTGASGSLLSIGALTVTVWAFARTVLMLTGSPLGALTAAALVLANPNLLYLHATPMTEPLLIAACALSVLWTVEWVWGGSGIGDRGSGIRDPGAPPWWLGVALFAAAWTRYEAWAVIAALWIVVASSVGPRRAGQYAAWPAAAVLLFLANSRITVGQWLVSGGFYVPDAAYQGRPFIDFAGVWWGAGQLSGYVVSNVAFVSAAVLARRAAAGRERVAVLCAISLLAAGALPFYAMFEGHPYRIRYMIPVVAGGALLCGIAVGSLRAARARQALATALLAASLVEAPVWDQQTPLLEEVRWDVPSSLERRAVRACLARDYRGEKILASMGSLAHLMQELSHEGLAIADFIHEGNGSIWELALETGPAPHAGWMLVEEESEGGDVLASRVRRDASFAARMQRVCEGGGVALYQREGQRSEVRSHR
jgi:hypothetical protein